MNIFTAPSIPFRLSLFCAQPLPLAYGTPGKLMHAGERTKALQSDPKRALQTTIRLLAEIHDHRNQILLSMIEGTHGARSAVLTDCQTGTFAVQQQQHIRSLYRCF
jgi:hypothetical protein